MKPGFQLLAIVFASLCCVCCPRRNGVHLAPGERIEKPEELLAAMRERGLELGSLRAEGTILMRRGGKRLKAHMLLVIRRPATLRFETISFFEQPLSILVTDGMEFSLWDMDKGRFYTGAATPKNVSRVIPIPMDGPEVAGILLGDPPLIPFATSSLDWDNKNGLYILTLKNSQQHQEIRIHPTRLRPTEVLCKANGREYYRLVYEDWLEEKPAPPVIKKVLFTMPSENIRLSIKIREAERNPELQDDLFVLNPPEGIPVERLESNQ